MFEASASGQSLPLVSKSTQPQNQSKCVHSLLLTVYAPVKVMTDLEWLHLSVLQPVSTLHLSKRFASVLLGSPVACRDEMTSARAAKSTGRSEVQSNNHVSIIANQCLQVVDLFLCYWEYTTTGTSVCVMVSRETVLSWPNCA